MARAYNCRYVAALIAIALLSLKILFFILSDDAADLVAVAEDVDRHRMERRDARKAGKAARAAGGDRWAAEGANASWAAAADQVVPVRRIAVGDKLPHRFWLGGALFGPGGVEERLNLSVQSSLVHSFSPMAESVFREAMVDPLKAEQRIYANSPAIIWKDGQLIVVMRIWLEKEKYDLAKYRVANVFSDNYFIAQTFDRQLRPTRPGHVMGIPTRVHAEVGDGPIEPRIFEVGGRLYVTFNTAVMVSHRTMVDSTFIWDYELQRCIVPNVTGGQPMTKNSEKHELPRDKHWSAFTDNERLHFVYNLDPLRVLRCEMPSARCEFVHFEGPGDYQFKQAKDTLRGGTPFVLYRYPYYLSIAHGTMFMNCTFGCDWRRFYTANLVVMSVRPVQRIVYVSGDIAFHPKLASSIPIVRFKYIRYPFLFPVSLVLEDADTLAIGGHVSDYCSIVLRLRGIKRLMQIIQQRKSDSAAGPPVGALHAFVKQAASESSGFSFHWA